MTGAELLFWLFAASTAFGAVAVVVSQNVVRMAFWLIVSLGSTAGLFFLLHADFVAATQLLIYVGGTLVLLIFGVMLTASGPYLQLKMSPGNLIAVSAAGVAFFFFVFQTVASVNWQQSILRQLVISEERYNTILETESQLAAAFEESESQGAKYYQLPPDYELEAAEAAKLLALLRENGLSFSPATETGGTVRPLGFGLLGARPDRDLNSPQGLQRVSEGYFIARRVVETPESRAANGEAEPQEALSTGYLLPFEIASVHLLVVLIGAAYLARAKRRVEASSV